MSNPYKAIINALSAPIQKRTCVHQLGGHQVAEVDYFEWKATTQGGGTEIIWSGCKACLKQLQETFPTQGGLDGRTRAALQSALHVIRDPVSLADIEKVTEEIERLLGLRG
jgi:hypothetical protein